MTINLFFITLTLSVSKRKNSKNDVERNQEIQKRMDEMKEKQFGVYREM
ncbi:MULTISPECIES: YrzI family small protein [Bacillaceae]|uniref:YrzI family small protein n=1 Tax=Metabacillus endolithicus TaxID=1535204 RepID=A0ABW5BVF4_9BACI|nr:MULTISPECIES: YrzI family small protein [Bacillaceae]MCM3161868.1 YrzI family small protein [Metabacillus litoralis]MCM3413049.1 YrzI family small protein [Metabacillus litoralis]UHA62404.1 YrzI family small protein [Metabacillus litoralis]UPG64624.1 YrzI family small protein [Metabacillus endolithicus]